jgi:lysophospholipase L1-like esterase
MPERFPLALAISLAVNLALLAAIAVAVHKLGGPSYLLFKMKTGEGTGFSVGREEHLKMLDATLPPGRIVFMGDSLTEAGEWGEMFGPSVVNRGIGGDSTNRILQRVAGVAKTKPSKVFLMAGINDLTYRTPADIRDRHQRIIEAIRAESPQTTVYLQSVLPVNNAVKKTGRDNAKVEELNKLLSTLDAVWIDLRPLFTDANGNLDASLTYDGLHLNGKAYAIWRPALAPYVQTVAPVASTQAVPVHQMGLPSASSVVSK